MIRYFRYWPDAAELAATGDSATVLTQEGAARRLGVSREALDSMLRCAPAGLPGHPMQVGQGESGTPHWQWTMAGLVMWAEAYNAYYNQSCLQGPAPDHTVLCVERKLCTGSAPIGRTMNIRNVTCPSCLLAYVRLM